MPKGTEKRLNFSTGSLLGGSGASPGRSY
jgi:hypothetical protein